MRKGFSLVLCVILLLGALSGCAQQPTIDPDDGKLHVVTTIFAPYDFAREIGGEDVTVTMLLKPGCEVHSYEPSPKDIIAIRNADVFLYVGGESDAWVRDVLAGVDNPNLRTVTLMDCVEALEEETVEGMQAGHEEHEHGHADETEYDEHVWTSPRNAALICEKLADAFAAADPTHADAYAQRCGAYVEQLNVLDAEFEQIVEDSARKTIIFADRFPLLYFADAYGLTYFAAYPGCADSAEPSAATVAFLIDKVEAEQIPVVFCIELSNQKLADTVCEATGAKKLQFSSCHNVTAAEFKDGATYLSIMRQNAAALREALN